MPKGGGMGAVFSPPPNHPDGSVCLRVALVFLSDSSKTALSLNFENQVVVSLGQSSTA